MTELEIARGMFPLMPDEVFSVWLGEIIAFQGWPFRSLGDSIHIQNWAGLLLDRPLAHWAQAAWSSYLLQGSGDLRLDPDSAGLCVQVMMGAFSGSNLVRGCELRDSSQRVQKHRASLEETNRFTGFITAWDCGGILRIADGHHRIAALWLSGRQDIAIPVWAAK